ncbi:MAG: hypothetical protein JWN99_1910 [Ilumatobacteraceae bacterium]|nr:hypothetical protein [Ilumatobacteraceae bacterium]
MSWTDNTAYRQLPARPPRPPHPSHPLPFALGALGVFLVSLIVSRYALDGVVRYHWPIALYVFLTGLGRLWTGAGVLLVGQQAVG